MQVTDRTLILTTVSGAGVPACRRTAVLLRCFVAVAMLMMSDTAAAQEYVLGPDSQRRPGVPTGVVTAYRWTSRIFPGTTRDYWIYVPAQYKPSTPAALMVFQDGDQFQNPKGSYRVPIVFDNLIHRSEMPVTIGVFINPGVLPSADTNTPARNNRSFEYDAVTDDYARFLLEEILPEVAKYNISDDPNSRAIGGVSSGAICAFTVAWHRPDAFRRVLSYLGSFTNLRGGDAYTSLIRKTEPKPIRVFLQSGKKDMNTYAGSWYIANQHLMASFEYMGYDAKLVLGKEGHNSVHGGSILPEALRWLWRDYPNRITTPRPPDSREWATNIVKPDKDWEVVTVPMKRPKALAADHDGNVFVGDAESRRIYKIARDGKVTQSMPNTEPIDAMAIGANGSFYTAQTSARRIVTYSTSGTKAVVTTKGNPTGLTVTRSGTIYYTDAGRKRVWFVDAAGRARVVHEGITSPTGVQLSSGGTLLIVADASGRSAWSFQVRPNGTLDHGEPFYRLETSDHSAASQATAVTIDSDRYAYFATGLGIQVGDLQGRTAFIVANPNGGRVVSLDFGGERFGMLYAIAGSKVFRRALGRTGARVQ
jgi:gluconolactonase